MAYVALNGFDVEAASSKLVYENLFPTIQHINGKGVTDKFTNTKDVQDVMSIDVFRLTPYAPEIRQLGASTNGKWANTKNDGHSNAPQSTHYSIPVDLVYDRGVPITRTIAESNQLQLESIVTQQISSVIGLTINVVTFAKQLEGFFRDSFSATPTSAEIAAAVYEGNASLSADAAGSYADAFLAANASFNDGIEDLGVFSITDDTKQAFISSDFNRVMKRQYMQNASESAARILANGFLNPFTNTETARIDSRTGLCGMYDGVYLFLENAVTRKFEYLALGVANNSNVVSLLDQIQAKIVYGNGTVRGIVGPTIEANKNPYYGGAYILPYLKMGVQVLSGKSIKLVISGTWTSTNIQTIMNAIAFTAFTGEGTTGFNDGTAE